VSAFTEGADVIRVRLQPTREGIPIAYPHADLSATTDGKGPIAGLALSDLQLLDAGYSFKLGKDTPWRKWIIDENPPHAKRHHQLSTLDELIDALGDSVTWALDFSNVSVTSELWQPFVERSIHEVQPSGAALILCSDEPAAFDFFERYHTAQIQVGLILAENSDGTASTIPLPDYVFISAEELLNPDPHMQWDPEKTRYVARLQPTADELTIRRAAERSWGIESSSVLNLAAQLGRWQLRFEDNFSGQEIDRRKWVAGISSGYPAMPRAMLGAIEDRSEFQARVTQNNGLIIEVDEGYQYASAAAVTRFSVSNPFVAETTFTYEHPERATEMVMCALASSVFEQHHREGRVMHPRFDDEHPAFDAHGLCPFVAVEREEADGSRIMHNASFSELLNLRVTNYYRQDVGAPESHDVQLRMARRGRYFTGHYKDELNSQWVGLGFVENSSLPSRVYFRLSAKHYPKSDAPDPLPWNRVTFHRFAISTRAVQP
jgi:hypothetical protein